MEDHGHCEICQALVTRGERFCGSEECDDKHRAAIKEKKKTMYLMVALIVLVLVLTKLPLAL